MKNKKQRFRVFVFAVLLISIISISGFVAYAMMSVSIPIEVKEPLSIIEYPTGFSLYAGETINFDFTVKNLASVTIFQEFEFLLNDTEYQKYVTFSNHNYSIPPGTHKLSAWLTITSSAPAANFVIKISKKTDTPTPTQTPTPNNSRITNLDPSLELLAGGARWAAQEGKSALYINWLDSYKIHHTTDGVDWIWYETETKMGIMQTSIIAALESKGFEITLAGDIPNDLTPYDVVVIYAYYAVEPHFRSIIRDHIYEGGNVVLLSGTPTYFTIYSKSLNTGYSLEQIDNWFGASRYHNDGGYARVAFNNPFGTSLLTSTISYFEGSSNAAVSSLRSNAKPIAYYDSGKVFAFTNEYGAGRVYYQAQIRLLENN